MSHILKEKAPPAHYDTLLEQANGIYLEIVMHYQTMQNDLSATSSRQTMQTVDTLNTLLHKARAADSLIADALYNGSGLSASTSALMEKRAAILNRLYQANRNIAARAKNVQSLLRHEISSLSTNHKAITGYKPSGSDRTHIIRAAF